MVVTARVIRYALFNSEDVLVCFPLNLQIPCVCDCRLEFENAYIDEKEDACQALGEIAYNTG